MPSDEIKAIGAIEDALAKIEDEDTLNRILNWAVDKYATQKISMPKGSGAGETPIAPPKPDAPPPPVNNNEIRGIAIYNGDDNITFTFRDIKANNARDAAVRLALVSTYVYEQFTGNPIAPRQKTLKPLLKEWRIDRGSSRDAISKHRGIITEGMNIIRLDFHAKEDAKKAIQEILDEKFKGKWNPNQVGKKAKKTTKK